MHNMYPTLICLILLANASSMLQAQQPFPCDGQFYVTLSGSGLSSRLIGLSKDSSLSEPPIATTISDDLGLTLTAIGFNSLDNLIYGLDKNTHELVRIDANGVVQKLGIPANLSLELEYLAGDVRPQGGALMVVGHEPGGGAAMTLYTINLQPPYYAGLASIISDEPVRITDIAYDPIFGSLVGFDEIKKRLVKVTMGGLVTSINYAQQLQLNSLDALFFDRWGLLYGHDGAGGQGLKLFNKFDGRVQKSFYGPAGSNGDGCSCPYRLRFFKQITPQLVVPCSEILVTYHLYNTAGIAHGQKTLVDEFPPDFTISEIVRKPYSTVVSGVGTNLLELQGMEVLLGWDSLVVRVDVGSLSGEYAGQAVAGGFPLSLGTELYSDNPNTSLPNDPTPITVADTGQVILQKMPTICPGTSTPLTAAANGISYRWSNGSVQSSIAASEPGLYWVEVEGACGTYRDSVWVEMAPQAWIDLGENIEVPYAQQLRLDFSTNAGPGASFFWQASGTALDCSTCPNPSATITGPAVFSVTLTDENGCTATDKVSVSVKEARSIYFPNVFSPNDDGINDLFYPQADGAYPLLSLRVYDRWGGLVFEKMEGTVNDPAAGWNGRAAKGGAAAAGLYRWEALIDYGNGIHRPFTGNVLVVR